MGEPEFQRTLRLSQIPRGQMRACLVGDREIVLCHTKEGVFALDNICTHAHTRMNEGSLRGVRLICPLHGASFDVRDGRVLGAPARQPLLHHSVRVVDDFVEVAIDSTRNQSTSA
jgi:3-phenylpropionate/trans-cinnamate dioxygenase ferredoxin subunit